MNKHQILSFAMSKTKPTCNFHLPKLNTPSSLFPSLSFSLLPPQTYQLQTLATSNANNFPQLFKLTKTKIKMIASTSELTLGKTKNIVPVYTCTLQKTKNIVPVYTCALQVQQTKTIRMPKCVLQKTKNIVPVYTCDVQRL